MGRGVFGVARRTCSSSDTGPSRVSRSSAVRRFFPEPLSLSDRPWVTGVLNRNVRMRVERRAAKGRGLGERLGACCGRGETPRFQGRASATVSRDPSGRAEAAAGVARRHLGSRPDVRSKRKRSLQPARLHSRWGRLRGPSTLRLVSVSFARAAVARRALAVRHSERSFRATFLVASSMGKRNRRCATAAAIAASGQSE